MATTQDLAERLLSTAPEHEGWSLVESSNSGGFLHELLEWAEGMTHRAWSLDYAVRRQQLGLVLLWLESEVARRRCGEGAVWPILSNREIVRWHPEVHWELFSGAGNATANHRELLRDSARRYSLRNTFDEDEGQNWYRLIYLQVGFTHDDAVMRLAPWLSGQLLPVSVQRLLEADDSGARAFQQLWRSLRMFRLGNIPKATLEARLQSTPWVLPDWCGDLVEAASRSSAQVMEVADLDATDVKFFTPPKLGLSPRDGPFFTTSVCNLSQLGLDAADYHFKSGDKVLARLMRQADGSFQSDTAEAITLPLQPTVSLSLVGADGRIVAYDEAVLWDPMEEVSLYSRHTGALIPPGDRLRAGTGVSAIAAADVSLLPVPAESLELPLGYRLHRIAPGWEGQIEAVLDEDVVWTSSAVESSDSQHATTVSATFTQPLDLRDPEWDKAQPPWNLPIRFRFPAGWNLSRLRWRRGDGQRVEMDRMPSHLTLTEIDAVRSVVLRVRITDGDVHRTAVVRAYVPFVAVLKWSEKGIPRRHAPGKNLHLGDAQRLTWSFSLPVDPNQARDAREFSFAEGTRLLSRLKARPSRLPDLAGYGAPLTIVDDPYQSDHTILRVADCVLDGGVLGAVRWSLEDGGFRIRSRFTDLGPDHCLQVWHSINGEPSAVVEIPQAELIPMDDGWLWKDGRGRQLHAMALTFRGTRLGAWFDHPTWSNALATSPPHSVEATAAMLRAWKAPILKKEGGHCKTVTAWFSENLIRVLPVWLAQGTRPGPAGGMLIMPPLDEPWLSAVNDLLIGFLPTPEAEAVAEFVEKLAPNCKGVDALGSAVWTLAKVCPLFTAQVVKVYLEEFVSRKDRLRFLGQLLALPDFACSEERAEELGKKAGNRDGVWLQKTVPSLAAVRQNHSAAISRAYRILSKKEDYAYYALGRWLREIG
jgi:hypothetical protein